MADGDYDLWDTLNLQRGASVDEARTRPCPVIDKSLQQNDAVLAEVRVAFRELSRLYHPDKHVRAGEGVHRRCSLSCLTLEIQQCSNEWHGLQFCDHRGENAAFVRASFSARAPCVQFSLARALQLSKIEPVPGASSISDTQ